MLKPVLVVLLIIILLGTFHHFGPEGDIALIALLIIVPGAAYLLKRFKRPVRR